MFDKKFQKCDIIGS